jgi:hypothetical protein
VGQCSAMTPEQDSDQRSRHAFGSARERHRCACSVSGVTRFVIDCDTLLRIAAGEIEVATAHKLVAPTLVRSRALSALYEAAQRGEMTAAEGLKRVTRINSLKVRFLGDKVLQRTAWRIADQLGLGDDLRGRIRRADAATGGRLRHFGPGARARGIRRRQDRHR